jgi:hypothetical protein
MHFTVRRKNNNRTTKNIVYDDSNLECYKNKEHSDIHVSHTVVRLVKYKRLRCFKTQKIMKYKDIFPKFCISRKSGKDINRKWQEKISQENV